MNTIVLCPLKQEAEALTASGEWKRGNSPSGNPMWRRADSDAAVVVCGVGKKAVIRAVNAMSETQAPDMIFEFGIAGALVNAIHIGDVILTSETIMQDDPLAAIKWNETQLERAAQKIKDFRIFSGKVLTTNAVITTKEMRDELAHKYKAVAVTMETYHFAIACRALELPCRSIRIISDMALSTPDNDYLDAVFRLFSQKSEALWNIINDLKQDTD